MPRISIDSAQSMGVRWFDLTYLHYLEGREGKRKGERIPHFFLTTQALSIEIEDSELFTTTGATTPQRAINA